MTGFRCSMLYGNPNDGEAWNDGTYSNVRNIIVRSNVDVVTSVQFKYGLEGTDPSVSDKYFDGGKHGGTDGEEKVFTLQAGEYLTDISGYSGIYNGANIIKSLSFRTNKGPRGTAGSEEGSRFKTTGNGKIVGCRGTADGDYLYSIGVYVHS